MAKHLTPAGHAVWTLESEGLAGFHANIWAYVPEEQNIIRVGMLAVDTLEEADAEILASTADWNPDYLTTAHPNAGNHPEALVPLYDMAEYMAD